LKVADIVEAVAPKNSRAGLDLDQVADDTDHVVVGENEPMGTGFELELAERGLAARHTVYRNPCPWLDDNGQKTRRRARTGV